MTKCDTRSYNDIPATIEDFKSFVNDLAQKKMEGLGDENPCKEVASDKYDDPSTSVECKKVAHETRFYAATYARRYVREAAARALDPFYEGQMSARDKLLVQVTQEDHYNWTSLGIPLFAMNGPMRVAATLNNWWSSATDFFGIGSASDFWDSTKNGTNLQCIGKDNICTDIEDQVNRLENTFTAHKKMEDDSTHFLLLTPYHVLYSNKVDPDECKVDFRQFIQGVDAWTHQLTNKMVGLHVIAPLPEEEEDVEDAAPEDTTETAECAPAPICPSEKEIKTLKKTSTTCLSDLENAKKVVAAGQTCKTELNECVTSLRPEVAKLKQTSAELLGRVTTAEAEAQVQKTRAEAALAELAALKKKPVAEPVKPATLVPAPVKPVEPAKKAAPAVAKPVEPIKKAEPKPASTKPRKTAPPTEPRPVKPTPKPTPTDDGGILKI